MATISLSRLERAGGVVAVRLRGLGLTPAMVPAAGLIQGLKAAQARWGALLDGPRDRLLLSEEIQRGLAGPDPREHAYLVLHVALNDRGRADEIRLKVLDALLKAGCVHIQVDPHAAGVAVVIEDPAQADGTAADTARRGAGLAIDQHVRREGYPGALLVEGSSEHLDVRGKLPSSEVYADFFEMRTGRVALKPEVDHAFDLDDFVDALTAEDALLSHDALERLPAGVIHNYTPLNPRRFNISDAPGGDGLLFGTAIVREGERISWVTLMGFRLGEADLGLFNAMSPMDQDSRESRSARVDGYPDHVPVAFWASTVRGADQLERAGYSAWLRQRVDIPYGEADLSRYEAMGREAMADAGDEVPGPGTEMPARGGGSIGFKDAGRAFIGLFGNRTALSITTGALMLPSYFGLLVEQVVSEPVEEGRLAAVGTKLRADEARPMAAPDASRYRILRTLRRVDLGAVRSRAAGTGRRYAPPAKRVAVDGFWRPLRPHAIGKGPTGLPEIGRTWVVAHDRWKSLPPGDPRIGVKQPVMKTLEAAKADPSSLDARLVSRSGPEGVPQGSRAR